MKLWQKGAILLILILSLSGVVNAETDCPSEDSCKLWGEFLEKYGEPSKVEWREDTDALDRIWALNYDTGAGPVTTEEEAEDIAIEFFEDTKGLWKINIEELKPHNIEYMVRFREWKVEFKQYHADIPVYGGSAGMTFTEDGKIFSAGSGIYHDISAPTTPEISKRQAVKIAKKEIEKYYYSTMRTDASFLSRLYNTVRRIIWVYRTDDATATLVIFPEKKNDLIEYHLAWHIDLHPYHFYVDAVSGEIVDAESHIRY
jgi:Zn-dependent metalloprotease